MSQDSIEETSSQAMIRIRESRCTRPTEAVAENRDSSNGNATVFANRTFLRVSFACCAFTNQLVFRENSSNKLLRFWTTFADVTRDWNSGKFHYPSPLALYQLPLIL